MRQFQDRIDVEIKESQESRQQMTKEINQQWGQFSQMMGQVAENLVAPSLPRILAQVMDCPKGHVEFSAVQVKRRTGSKRQEFDVVVVCEDYVLVNETKNRLRSEDIIETTKNKL